MEWSKKDIELFNILNVEVGSTGYKGGDSGAGGKTILRLQNGGSTVWTLKYEDEYGSTSVIEQPQVIEIEMKGDSEMQSFIEALEFTINELRHFKYGK
ncbi:hypothetical protein [Halobacillus sp. K22]|uniref:hypothetical protein n=1 Tax=Halobacillus sp. K22 TaxID=3457431 RepID=UPI003FCEAC2B